MTRIYHNPRCSKSRQTLALLEDRGERPEVVLYLVEPPERRELEELCDLLGVEPVEIVRLKDPKLKALGIAPGEVGDRDAWLDLLVEHPALLERPIVVKGGRAAVGRPPERVLDIL